MKDNLPENFRDVEEHTVVGTDTRGYDLTHYVLAERCLQVEYHKIALSIREGVTDDTLVYILEGGFRGFHKFTGGELWSEWREVETLFWELYDSNSLPWEVYDKDPLLAKTEKEQA